MSPRDAERALIRAAYLEWRVARAYSTGVNVDIEPSEPRSRFAPEVEAYLSASWPPGRFIREELGFALDQGPSLAWTVRTLERQNAAAIKMLGPDAPRRATYPKGEKRTPWR